MRKNADYPKIGNVVCGWPHDIRLIKIEENIFVQK